MAIDKFIPNGNQNWVVKHDTIYFKKGGLIPISKKIDGIYFISLDRRAIKEVIRMVKKFEELNQDFLFCDRLTICEKHIYREDLERIIGNYLLAIGDEVFFKFITNSDFDYLKNFTNFLTLFDSYAIFKERYEHFKRTHFNKLWMDWYTRKQIYQVKNELIRDYYSIFERQMKLNIFFS